MKKKKMKYSVRQLNITSIYTEVWANLSKVQQEEHGSLEKYLKYIKKYWTSEAGQKEAKKKLDWTRYAGITSMSDIIKDKK